MSFTIRPTPLSPTHHKTSLSRKITITLLILLSLFLIGTVIVLSSVSYWLAIPSVAYLNEDEVVWNTRDKIESLKYDPQGAVLNGRQVDSGDGDMLGSLGAEGVPIPEIWETLEDELKGDEMEGPGEVGEVGVNVEAGAGAEEEEEVVWDVDGEGSGGYWMKEQWDGHVQGTHAWDRLYNVTARPGEKIPRLIHQTWKNDRLPPKWRKAWKECREGMQDYEYMLWTDETSREFVKAHYPAHLQMFDSYKYPIQRADSIRYFVLHHFGGIYMDLDIGCRRRMDELLQGDWEVILPITKPVGVSNDLIFSSKGSAFMDDTVHALPAWNHEWFSNYPTVMFSTGPMFLSGQYAVYSSAHPLTSTHPRAEVRILPKSLYGKNAPIPSVPHSFFTHFYGSSWHDDDAGFITFLGAWGKKLMYLGMVVIILGVARLLYLKITGRGGSGVNGSLGKEYHLLDLLPTSSIGLGSPRNSLGESSPTSTSTLNAPFSPNFDMQHQQLPGEIASAFRRAGNLILAAPATLLSGERRNGNGNGNGHGRRRTGLLYFVPALFQPGPVGHRRGRTASEASQLPLRRSRSYREGESGAGNGGNGSGGGSGAGYLDPPPYEGLGLGRMDEGMEEVDAFLKNEEGRVVGEGDEQGIEGKGKGKGRAKGKVELEADTDARSVKSAEWAMWDKDGKE